jgi:hypothetical protein
LRVQLAAPSHGENVSLLVAVRVRPILQCERDKGPRGGRDILRVMDDRVVLVMDPDPNDKDYLDQVQNRSKARATTSHAAARSCGCTCGHSSAGLVAGASLAGLHAQRGGARELAAVAHCMAQRLPPRASSQSAPAHS